MRERPRLQADSTGPGKSVLFSADDFGISPLVNAAVAKAHRVGMLGSAGLMVTGAAFREAVQFAKEYPTLSVGLHLTLLQARPVLSDVQLPHLSGRSGQFPENPVWAGFQFYFQRAVRKELAKEIEAQLVRFLKTGLEPTHIDGHHHLHVHPAVFPIVLKLMKELSVPAIRLPVEDARIHLRIDSNDAALHRGHALIFRLLCRQARRQLRERGIAFPDHFLGLLGSGRMTETYLLEAIPHLPAGVTEIGMHPALELPPELSAWAPNYQYGEELRALTSQRVRASLTHHGFRPASFRELPHVSVTRVRGSFRSP